MHHKPLWQLTKRANRGFRGYPIATVAFYGPDDRTASKAVVGIVLQEGAEVAELERWFSDEHDVRGDSNIANAMLSVIDRFAAKSVALEDRIIGCPHEEVIDYPLGQPCPKCPFWASRDCWTGEVLP